MSRRRTDAAKALATTGRFAFGLPWLGLGLPTNGCCEAPIVPEAHCRRGPSQGLAGRGRSVGGNACRDRHMLANPGPGSVVACNQRHVPLLMDLGVHSRFSKHASRSKVLLFVYVPTACSMHPHADALVHYIEAAVTTCRFRVRQLLARRRCCRPPGYQALTWCIKAGGGGTPPCTSTPCARSARAPLGQSAADEAATAASGRGGCLLQRCLWGGACACMPPARRVVMG